MSATAPPTPTTPRPQEGEQRMLEARLLTRTLRRPELGAFLGAVAVFVLFTLTDSTPGHLWLGQIGLSAWLSQASFFGIVAVPVGLLMIAGEFDLSTGVMTGVTAILMALLVGKWHLDAWLALLVTVVFALLVGLFNGVLVAVTGLPSFIITLASFFILRGASVGGVLLLNQSSTQVSVANTHSAGLASLHTIFGSSFAASATLQSGYTTAIIWFAVVTAICTWVLGRTAFGNWIFAVGGDPGAARNMGVPVKRTKIVMFLVTALAAALVGVISFAQSYSAVSEQGVGYEFFYIIAAVVGGCLLTGGYGSAIGAAIGACVIGMAFEGVIYAGWDSSWDFAFLGGILVLAVVVNTVVYRRAMRARR
ncbi:MAG TPA: ABC transporter permease [Solirubrobacteraceae bacterium]|nr:ABC transporter permease [Solirubrobacteraceae bacterium]